MVKTDMRYKASKVDESGQLTRCGAIGLLTEFAFDNGAKLQDRLTAIKQISTMQGWDVVQDVSLTLSDEIVDNLSDFFGK